MNTPTIEKHLVRQFWQSRGGFLPIAIVEKMMQGSIEETQNYFDGQASGDAKVSAHYGIARDGRVWQFVPDEDTAWSNGVLQSPDLSIEWLKEVHDEQVNCNLVTLSIEYEGYSGDELTEEQYQAALELHRDLIERWHIEADTEHLVGHNRLDSVERPNNPGVGIPLVTVAT